MSDGRFRNDRVSLRALELTDIDGLQAYLNDDAMIGRRYVPWGVRDVAPFSRQQVTEILESWSKEKKAFTLGVELVETGELVGHAGCHWGWDAHCPSVWVVVAPVHQRLGIGSGAAELLLAHLFEDTPAHNVNSWVSSWNEDALAFAQAHGFTESGRIPRGGLREGDFFDEVMLDILKPEWLARKGAPDVA